VDSGIRKLFLTKSLGDNMIKYILFDMDGVLINTEPLHYKIWKQIVKEQGVDMDYESYKGCIGSTREYLYKLLYDAYGIDFSGNEEITKRFSELKDESIAKNGIPRVEGAEEIVRYLYSNGYKLAVASSSPQKYIESQMKELGIDDCFEILFSAECVKHPKPAPDVFLEVADRLNAPADQCVVIEDSGNGSKAAKAAGMLCYGIYNPDSGEQDLSAADKVLDNIKMLREEFPTI
jgi:HAD superfamily hydrolase (TIGR01509 family)